MNCPHERMGLQAIFVLLKINPNILLRVAQSKTLNKILGLDCSQFTVIQLIYCENIY